MPMRVPSLSEKETKEVNTSVKNQQEDEKSTNNCGAISYHCYRAPRLRGVACNLTTLFVATTSLRTGKFSITVNLHTSGTYVRAGTLYN